MKYLLIIFFIVFTSTAFAQKVNMDDLLTMVKLPPEQFDNQMFRKGFSCQKRHGSITDWLCIYAYQQANYLNGTKSATALMEYISNTQSTVLVYQMQSKELFLAMQKQLLALGFKADNDTSLGASGRRIFQKGKFIINFREADQSNGILGNYTGYSISVMYNRISFQSTKVAQYSTEPFVCPVRVAIN